MMMAAAIPNQHSSVDFKGLRVLLVDDEPHVLRALSRVLHHAFPMLDVELARDGKEALRIMAERDVQLVVSDIEMPTMNGLELLGHVAKRHAGAIRIVHSSYCGLGANDLAATVSHEVLPKPATFGQIVRVTEHALTRWLESSVGTMSKSA